jgi:thiosulfate dehydrogenase [quinone] large subunit
MTAAPAIPSPAPTAAADGAPHPRTEPPHTLTRPARRALAAVRILLGFVFLWAFADKLLGLGFSTAPAKSWAAGGSPTAGYLGSLKGWFADALASLAGQAWVEWSFMLGLLLVGGAFTLGVALRGAAFGGTLLLALMWVSALPLKSNPVVDSHVVYAAVMIALAAAGAGSTWGLARLWDRLLAAAPAPVRAVLS